MPPVIDKEKCVRCGLCAQICPLDVLFQDRSTREILVRYPDECWHCRACAIDCPKQAIHLRYPLTHFMLTSDGSYEQDTPEHDPYEELFGLAPAAFEPSAGPSGRVGPGPAPSDSPRPEPARPGSAGRAQAKE